MSDQKVNGFITLIVKVMTIVFWIIIFLAIFIPNSLDFWTNPEVK